MCCQGMVRQPVFCTRILGRNATRHRMQLQQQSSLFTKRRQYGWSNAGDTPLPVNDKVPPRPNPQSPIRVNTYVRTAAHAHDAMTQVHTQLTGYAHQCLGTCMLQKSDQREKAQGKM